MANGSFQFIGNLKGLKQFILLILLISLALPNYAQWKLFHETEIPLTMNGQVVQNPWAGGLNSMQFSNFDFDGDGTDDLFAYDRTANKASIFLRKNNQWQYAPEFEYLLPANLSNWAIFVDMDCDGERDLLTGSPFGIRIFKTSRNVNLVPSFELVRNPLLTEGSSGKINLQVSSTDVPYIGDVNGDGLPDILVYNFANGGFVEYHKNISLEVGTDCGAMEFRRETREWGDFEECDCNEFAFGGEGCGTTNARVEHAGGKSLLLIDMNQNGLPDLITGHELCEELYYLENTGSSETAKFESFVNQFPNQQNPVNSDLFPAPYWVDADNDRIKDLLVSTNLSFNQLNQTDFQNSIRLYKNIGSNEAPNFEFVQRNFLQDQMLDLGENSSPTSADLDGDGLVDILIGNRGQMIEGSFKAQLTLLRNIGTAEAPAFEVVDSDFANISSLNLSNLKPTLIDFDGDDIIDLVFSATQNNQTEVYWITGEANGGEIQFDQSRVESMGFTIGLNDNVAFHDINEDGKMDLLLAKSSGSLNYYLNTGEASNPIFTLETENYLGIDDNNVASNLTVVIADFTEDGKADLLTSDLSGRFTLYADFKNGEANPKQDLIELNGNLNFSRLANRSFLSAAKLYQNEAPVILAGSVAGGMQLFRSEAIITSIETPISEKLAAQIYPNPSNGELFINSPSMAKASIITLQGQIAITDIKLTNDQNRIDISSLNAGIYLLRIQFENGSRQSIKIIKR